jgi:hypothetical protein
MPVIDFRESDYIWQSSREFNKRDTLKVGSTVEMVPSRLFYKEAEGVVLQPTQFENLRPTEGTCHRALANHTPALSHDAYISFKMELTDRATTGMTLKPTLIRRSTR